MTKDIDNLLARYFGGNSSEQDMQALEQWISMSSENQVYFDELTELYAKLANNVETMPKPNTEQAKRSFMSYISMHANSQPKQAIEFKHKPLFNRWMFQAASVVLIFTLSISIWLIYSEHDVVLATQTTLKEGTLSDQTQIKLSKNSKIIYSSKYGKKSRKIRLEGMAFFAVGHKGKGTLQINADETFIEDIGTKFTVSAYPDSDKVRVNVREGKVHFYTTKNKGLLLSARETGIYDKNTKEFSVITPEVYSISKDIKHIQFNGKNLHDAMTVIAKAYGVAIHFEQPSIGERKITVNFDGENIDMVLQIIAETLDLNVKKEASGYLISNK
ncbi:MAG TPA: FecR family protein [Paludibacter sp.]|nr:FecR family protein [Paludibacter sp.]